MLAHYNLCIKLECNRKLVLVCAGSLPYYDAKQQRNRIAIFWSTSPHWTMQPTQAHVSDAQAIFMCQNPEKKTLKFLEKN